jgi:tetratricopeptide (TPR) repeat protein
MTKKRFLLPIFAIGLMVAACNNNNQQNGKSENEKETLSFLDSINQKIIENPRDYRSFFNRAEYYINVEKDLLLAANDADRLLGVDSTNAEYIGLRAEIFFLAGEFEYAKLYYEKSIEFNPDYAPAYNKLAELEFYLRNYNNAFKLINKSLKIDENQSVCYAMKGHIYREMGDSAKAASSFKTATEVNPNDYGSFVMLARLYGGIKNPLAIEYYNTAISLRPNLAEPRYGKGYLLQSMGLFKEAMLTYDELIILDSTLSTPHYNKGFIYLTEYDSLERAIDAFKKAIELEPTYAEAYYNLGLTYEFLSDFNNAKLNYQQALKLNPTYDLAALGMERVYKK